ncbi:acyltransferase family protein, partial [uncultured Phascolarctobacterium sp.]|uniref:acyltransferase family protein n=1 Tax=uncultured Phascolarctobacterium sp. TaxID=512296 RepID=UPI0025DF4A9C
SRAEQSRAEQSRAEQSRAEQSRARLSWLDVLKGIGIILVAIGHVYSNKTVFDWLYSFHMPLFFFAAGWAYSKKSVLTDVKKRFQTIVIPYFSFGFLLLFYWQLMERRFRSSDMGFRDSILGLFYGAYDYLDFNVHLWFLPCFFLTVVLFNGLVCLGNKYLHNGKILAYAVAVIMSVMYIVVPLPVMLWGFDRVFRYIGFYALGTFFKDKSADKKIQGQTSVWLIFEVLVLLGGNFVLAYLALKTGIMWFVTATVGIVGVLILSLMIDQNDILQYFGRISLVVLCIHGPVYRVIVKLVSIPLHMGTDAVRENLVLSLIVVVVTMMICSKVYKSIIRITPWIIGKENKCKLNKRDKVNEKNSIMYWK